MIRALAAIAMLWIPAAARAAPCMMPTDACAEWVTLGRGPARSLIYRTSPLDTRLEHVRRALIIIHDTTRDAQDYFRTAVAAALLAGALDDTIVIAPHFGSSNGACADTLAANEVNWPCEGNSWRSGGVARGGEATSFDFLDEIVRRVAKKTVFPNLIAIVVAGHSAGGQFVTRYEMANRVHDSLGVPMSYVVANPSSYAYPDGTRPASANGRLEFGAFLDRSCPDYDLWPYGLTARTGYAAKLSVPQLKKQLIERPTTYLLGQLDVLPIAAFDSSCAALAQGPTRLARGQAFAAYVDRLLGAHHTVAVVPLCGHNPRCMLTSQAALRVLFPTVHESH